MSKVIKHIDEMVKECRHFHCADVEVNVNNGYNCSHPDQEEFEEVNGVKVGKCYCWSCPMACEADEEDFDNPEIDKNGWDIDDYEEMTFLVIETEES